MRRSSPYSSFSEFEKLVCEMLEGEDVEVLPVSKEGVSFQYATRDPESGEVKSTIVFLEDGNQLETAQLQEFASEGAKFGAGRVQVFTPSSFSPEVAMEALGLCISLNDGASVSAALRPGTPPGPKTTSAPRPLLRILSPATRDQPKSWPGKSPLGIPGSLVAGTGAVFLLVVTAQFTLKVVSGRISSKPLEAESKPGPVPQSELPVFPLNVPSETPAEATPPDILNDHFARLYGVEQISEGSLKRLASALAVRSTGELPHIDLDPYRENVDEVWKDPARYPGMATALIRDIEDEPVRVRTAEALLPILESHGDPFLLLKAKAERAELSQRPEDIQEAVDAVRTLLDRTYGMEQHAPCVQVAALFAGPMNYVMEEMGEEIVEIVSSDPAIPEWLSLYVEGRYHINAAWKSRGRGWAYTVTQEGWEGFYRELKLASNSLQKSWKENPELPYAPGSMVTVCLGASLPDEETRRWFLRAIETEADYIPAYRSYMYSILPRWGGSDPELASFGIACLNSNRYDTRIPSMLLEAHHNRAMEWKSAWEYWRARPDEEIRDLRKMFAAYANSAKNPDVRNYYRSVEIAFVFTSADRNEARDLLAELGADFNKPAAETFPFPSKTILSSLGVELAGTGPSPATAEE